MAASTVALLHQTVADLCDDLMAHFQGRGSQAVTASHTSVDYKFGSGAVCVRAESDGTQQTDREYTVTLEAADGSGNKTTRPFVISIPHDQGGGNKCKDRVVEFVDDNDPRCVQNAP